MPRAVYHEKESTVPNVRQVPWCGDVGWYISLAAALETH